MLVCFLWSLVLSLCKADSLSQNGGLLLFYTAPKYNSYRESKLPISMEASLFSIQLLDTALDCLCLLVACLWTTAKTTANQRTAGDIPRTPQPKPGKTKKAQWHSTKAQAKTRRNHQNTMTFSKNQSQDRKNAKKHKGVQQKQPYPSKNLGKT